MNPFLEQFQEVVRQQKLTDAITLEYEMAQYEAEDGYPSNVDILRDKKELANKKLLSLRAALCKQYVAWWTKPRLLTEYEDEFERLCVPIRKKLVIRVLNDALQLGRKQYNRFVKDLFNKGAVKMIGCMWPYAQKNGGIRELFWQYFKKDQQFPKGFWAMFSGSPQEKQLKQNIAQACIQCCTHVSMDDIRLYAQEDKRFKNLFKLMDAGKSVSTHVLLDYIPQDYTLLYPAARTIERHFVLHIGPTNSGKSHDAVQALHQATDGIYCGPLRLLAFEQYEKLNQDGVICSLRTGEEEIEVPFATVQSSTIDMLDVTHHFDVAVIDEAQMVRDPDRGGCWTKALLGIMADEVHVCLAPEAQDIVCKLIDQCHDTYEIVRHQRFNQLMADPKGAFRFPADAMTGDAFIVFSRASVHACAAELQKRGISASIIYGNLPYDVRQNEARRFRNGETQVVVATDAIGMGLNLPIKRVAFLETEKFNGIRKATLTPAQIRQIAGRAGRFGLFEYGLYTAQHDLPLIQAGMATALPQLKFARLEFPDTLLGIDAPLTKIFESWKSLPTNANFEKASVDQQIQLATMLQKECNDKRLLFTLASMPFNPQHAPVFELWTKLSRQMIHHDRIELDPIMNMFAAVGLSKDLNDLERDYRMLDLLYHFARHFAPDYLHAVSRDKQIASGQIMYLLSKGALEPRRCRHCGAELRWNTAGSYCAHCRSF